jgi:hypothetical protein
LNSLCRPRPQPNDRPFTIELPEAAPPVSVPAPVRRPSIDDPRVALPEAQNKGFLPNTVVLESGFKPIRKETDPELPPAFEQAAGQQQGESGVEIRPVAGNPLDTAPVDTFNPVFRPSPTADLPEGEEASLAQTKPGKGAIIRPSKLRDRTVYAPFKCSTVSI